MNGINQNQTNLSIYNDQQVDPAQTSEAMAAVLSPIVGLSNTKIIQSYTEPEPKIIEEITRLVGDTRRMPDTVTAVALTYLGALSKVPEAKTANKDAMVSFWRENHAKLEADPGISPYIEACRNSMLPGTTWEGLKNYQKLSKLFVRMSDGLTAADIPTFGRALDLSFYSDSAQFKALDRVRPRIANVLPETAGFSTRQLRAFMNDPANAARIQTITELNLSGLELTILPSEIYTFTNLTELILNNNRLKSVPSVERLISLKHLDLSNNQITTLAGAILPAGLEILSLLENKIASLAGVVFPATQKQLFLEKNEITSLAGAVFPDGIQEINLMNNQIRTVADVEFPVGLPYLYLSHNPIPTPELVDLRQRLVQLRSLLTFDRVL